jgi:outer membrane protein assembly factor BamD
MRRGTIYHTKGSNPAAANRLQSLTDQYPLYSAADEANMLLGDSYSKMGGRFRQKSGEAFARVVREYPLSPYAEDAKKRLQSLELPIPEADPVAYARMKYELENRKKAGITSQAFGLLKRGPDVRMSAKSGSPAMTTLRPSVPASVPVPAATGAAGFSGDVTVAPITDPTLLETKPDARQNPPAAQTDSAAKAPDTVAGPDATAKTDGTVTAQPAAATDQQPLPTNRDGKQAKQKKAKKKKVDQ